MKKIAVVGLGIIGGSISASLSRAGYVVDGSDLRAETVQEAISRGYIHAESKNLSDYDVVFLALPPDATATFLEHGAYKTGALVMDICGVKGMPEKIVYAKPRIYRYVGLHPMAGKETSGLSSASSTLFDGANLVLVRAPQTREEDLAETRNYAAAMRFGNILECTAEEHDRKIALTSQLAHIVSNAYVKSPQVRDCYGFTGGSFQDMTRIAGVDENMWAQLYTANREALLSELNGLIAQLCVYRAALETGDDEGLRAALREGRIIREKIKRKGE